MKTKRYTLLVMVTVVGCLLFASDLSAQRGRYHRGGRYHGGYYPRAYAYNRPFVSLHFGGVNFRYQSGYYYRPYGSVYRMSRPPIGIRIGLLPPGYRTMYVGPNPYYYYEGTYYRSLPSREFEVIQPPLGATVDALPPGARVTVIDGQKYYEFNGTFYQEAITSNNELTYTVVGTDGVLNTDNGAIMEDDEDVPAAPPASTGPQMGDRFEALPQDAKPVVIQGQKFYTTGSGLYYKEVLENNKVYYEVVGK